MQSRGSTEKCDMFNLHVGEQQKCHLARRIQVDLPEKKCVGYTVLPVLPDFHPFIVVKHT